MKKNPKWFDLKNYLQPMSNEEWAYHIYVRSKLFVRGKFKNWRGAREIFTILKKGNFLEKSLLETIQEDYSINFAGFISKDLEGFRATKQPITVLSIEETVARANKLVNEYHYALTDPNDENQIKSPHDEVNSDLREIIEKAVFGNTRLITYSLDHTDAEILKAIRQHLKEIRSKSEKMYIFSESIGETLHEFHQFRLLALFDLLYWKEFEDPKLTYAVIGDLVWPDDIIEIDQRIRKKGLPLIKMVFHREIAQRIYHNRSTTSC